VDVECASEQQRLGPHRGRASGRCQAAGLAGNLLRVGGLSVDLGNVGLISCCAGEFVRGAALMMFAFT